MPEKVKTSIHDIVTAELLEEIPAGICRFHLGDSLTILAANAQFCEIFGYTKEQAVRDGFDSMYSLMSEAEKIRIKSYIIKLRKGELPQKGEFELCVRRNDGCSVIVLIKYHYLGAENKCLTVNVIDITDRKKIEEALRIGESRYRLALNLSGKAFFFFDAEKRTMYLSDDLAQEFGLPNEVDNMPDNSLILSLVEPESVADYKAFYRRIIAGDEVGETIISCHMQTAPEKVLWYKIAFTSVFNSERRPVSTIIIYEEYTRQYRADIENKWLQADISAASNGEFYLSIEYDLTRGKRRQVVGEMAWMFLNSGLEYEVMYFPAQQGIVAREDCEAYQTLLNRERLLARFAGGVNEEHLECRMFQRRGAAPRWVRVTVNMIRDPYTDHVLSRTIFKDIDGTKTERLLIEENMAELKRKLDASRAKAMINQMQPHFLYNALSAIRTIVRRDPDQAYDLLYDFTVHLRSSIKAIASDDQISFADELKNIKAYLNIEKMRFGDRLNIVYEIDCENFKVIPLSIQPLAENATRHGIYPKGSVSGTVIIRSYEALNNYVVEVEDDGGGFDVQKTLHKKENSYGLANLMFRLEMLMHARVDIHSEIGRGTLIRVFFPKEDQNV